MHASMVKAQEHRNRERSRKKENDRKKLRNGLFIAFGMNPAFQSSHPEGNRAVRREKIRPELQARRFTRNLMQAFFYSV